MRIVSTFAGLILLFGCLAIGSVCAQQTDSQESVGLAAVDTNSTPAPQEQVTQTHQKDTRPMTFKRWKRRLPFWPRKGLILTELMLYICLGVLIAQILEVSGLIKYIAVLAWPVTRLGGLGRAAGPAFIMAFQSGAVANSMLVASTDQGQLNKRQLYSSVLVVSCLSLFSHLPTYVIPIGSVLGSKATAMLFGVRFVAIVSEIVVILLVSNLLIQPWSDKAFPAEVLNTGSKIRALRQAKGGFWTQVWSRSRKTLKRLILFLLPTFAIMVTAEYAGFFKWLSAAVPGLFTLSFLPPQATAIIPAQAMSLYNGAIAAASFLDDGSLTAKQAVLIILVGSLITAPIRTLKHALPTYIAVLGPRAGVVMAITAQVLRSIFLILCIVVMWFVWK
jgi:hypothetical protein